MAKRRAVLLTGGTGDVNPDPISFVLTESAANTFTQLEIPLPTRGISPVATARQNAIFEMLWVDLQVGVDGLVDADELRWQLSSTSQTAEVSMDLPSVYISDKDVLGVVTSGSFTFHSMRRYQFTSGDGHGVLIATDALFMGIKGVSLAAASTMRGKIYGRIKFVGLQEYLGLTLKQRAS